MIKIRYKGKSFQMISRNNLHHGADLDLTASEGIIRQRPVAKRANNRQNNQHVRKNTGTEHSSLVTTKGRRR